MFARLNQESQLSSCRVLFEFLKLDLYSSGQLQKYSGAEDDLDLIAAPTSQVLGLQVLITRPHPQLL